jgi:cyanate permease
VTGVAPGGARAWTLLLAFSVLLFLILACSYSALGVLLPGMIRDIGMSWPEAGMGFTLLGLANGLFAYLPAVLIRRLGVAATLAVGVLCMSAGFKLLAQADAVSLYYAGSALVGGGFVLLALIPGTYVLGRCFDRPELPFALYYTIGGLGQAAGPFMVMGVARLSPDWRTYWWAAAGFCAVAGAVCVALVQLWKASGPIAAKTGKAPVAPGDFAIGAALRTPQFAVITLGYLAHLLCGIVTTSFATSHLGERGIPLATAGAMLGAEGFFAAVARVGAGALGERVHPRLLLAGSAALLALGCTGLAGAQGFAGMALYAVGVGSGFGVAQLACTLLLIRYFGLSRNLELFALMCLSGAVAAFGSYGAGLMRDASGGFVLPFLSCAVLAAAVALGAALMKAPRRPTADAT